MQKEEWIKKCQFWKSKWPQLGLPEFEDDSRGINLYKFIEILNKNLKDDSTIVADAGSSIYVNSQALQLKESQRFLLDSAQAGMGASLPMSIGVCLARNKQETICITGDGSFNTNIQELAAIRYHNLPIKIFVWNNNGYLSIRNSQDAFYGGRRFGTDSKTGLYFPDIEKIAKSYEIEYMRVSLICNLDWDIKEMLKYNGPIICEVICDPNQKIQPSLAYKNGKSCPLQDMSPFLSEEEMGKEMIKDE